MEYKQGEIWGDYISPSSNRFITSHDTLSSSAIVIDMFFNTVGQFRPDLIILSGLHLMDIQPEELWQEKIKTIKRNLNQLSLNVPIHLELGSMAEREYAKSLMHKIVPYIDSIGLDEQELTFFSQVMGGPFDTEFPVQAGALHVHKVTEILFWLMKNFGRDKENEESKRFNYRLQRIHFHCLTYQMIVTSGPDWSNSAAALAAGARLAGRQSCGGTQNENSDAFELRVGNQFHLDKTQEKIYHFNAHAPLTSWIRENVLFLFTPVLVCKHPTKTVGVGDSVSATALMYSQFYRFEK